MVFLGSKSFIGILKNTAKKQREVPSKIFRFICQLSSTSMMKKINWGTLLRILPGGFPK